MPIAFKALFSKVLRV